MAETWKYTRLWEESHLQLSWWVLAY